MFAALLAASACGSAAAQQVSTERLTLAGTAGAWVVEVATTGGFTGRGVGNFAVRADGATTCTMPLRCAAVASDGVGHVAAAVAGVTTTAWTQRLNDGRCSDCVTTTLTIRRRASDGAERSTTYSWTVVDTKEVPGDVQSVFDAAMSVIERRR